MVNNIELPMPLGLAQRSAKCRICGESFFVQNGMPKGWAYEFKEMAWPERIILNHGTECAHAACLGGLSNSMIHIQKSSTADTRTCDFANTTKETLLASSVQHIGDVVKAMAFFGAKITEQAGWHDNDKLTTIDWFHKDFLTGFKESGWWDNHRKITRHHISKEDGVPKDVNLIDVLEHICDCVMAGMARSGSVYELKLSDELLQKAFQNTVELLKSQVQVAP